MTTTSLSRRRRIATAALAALVALGAAACGSDADAGDDIDAASETETATGTDTGTDSTVTVHETASTEPTTPSAPAIPEGITLRVGDQGGGLETPLRLSGQLDDLPYEVEFASFASGPLVNEAFAAGAIDIGIMGDTPALLSYASGLDTTVVGIRANDGVSMTLVARPGSGIESLEDLEGKQVAWTTGTNQHGFVLRALDSVGLSQQDVEQVNVPLTDVANVLASDQADAAVIYEVFRAPYLAEHPDAVELANLPDFTRSYIYLLGLRDVVEDAGKAAAIEDFVGRLARSGAWVDEHPEEFIQAYYVEGQKQTPEYGRLAHEAQGFTEWVEVGGEAQASQQEQADLFYEAGFLPDPVDLSGQFDAELAARFTAALEAANAPTEESTP